MISKNFFLNNNFREFFDYMNLEIKNLAHINKQFNNIRNDYEMYGLELIQKKEKLFSGTKYSSWELS
jgi:hypothetical protein